MEQFLFRSYAGTIPHLFHHYIDDCIGAASCSHEEFEQFVNFTNTFHPNLKFTWTISDTSLSFLDLSVSVSGDRLETDIYFKPTYSHSYLDYTSSHPPSCKNAILYSQFLRLRLVPRWGHLRSVRNKRQHLPAMNHFNSLSHSLGNMSILGLLQCHNDATQKLEEQYLIFCLGSPQPNGLNVDFT
eukprot:g31846.t1